jgi:hypothetical protein
MADLRSAKLTTEGTEGDTCGGQDWETGREASNSLPVWLGLCVEELPAPSKGEDGKRQDAAATVIVPWSSMVEWVG